MKASLVPTGATNVSFLVTDLSALEVNGPGRSSDAGVCMLSSEV